MGALRIFLRTRYLLAAGLIVFALAMKVIVPVGYMLNSGGSGLVLTLCPSTNPGMNLDPLHAPAPSAHAAHHSENHAGKHVADMSHDGHHQGAEQGEHGGKHADNPCPYSLMPTVWLAGADPLLLAIALLFILALGFAPVAAPRLSPVPFLWPPLRGPPAPAR